MLDVLARRRSIRKFTDQSIGQSDRDALIKAALLAPSAINRRPVELIVVENRDTLQTLSTCKKPGADALKTAPLAIVVLADSELSDVWVEDAAIAATNIMNEAEALGLGACWIQIRLRNGTQEPSNREVKALLGIPDRYDVLAVMAIGHKGEEKEGYSLDSLGMEKVHTERF